VTSVGEERWQRHAVEQSRRANSATTIVGGDESGERSLKASRPRELVSAIDDNALLL
jgi:hypothetical protein